MASVFFGVGDRVRTCTSRFVPAGLLGTIQQVYLLDRDSVYEVQFDGEFRLRLMHARDLEWVATPEHQRTAGAD
jgi:hypothetical protein